MAFNYVTGTVTIGFEALNASGNWIALDNFKLTLVGTDLSASLAEAITAAETLYGEGSGKEAAQLKTAIDAAHIVADNTSATALEQADAIVGMEQAADLYQRANASAENPLDMTARIVNPSFETGDLTGWTNTGFATQNNDIFSVKKGTWFVERWTWRGNGAGDARLSQRLTQMPAGRYRMKAVAQNTDRRMALVEEARAAAVNFLSGVSATDVAQPFNLTFMLENPNFDNDATTGWTSTNGEPGYDAQGAEFFEKTFNFYQTMENMPAGVYELRANAFQRPGTYDAVLDPYLKGTAKVTTSLFIGNTAKAVKHICDDRQSSAVFNDGGWGSDKKLSDNTYIPNCMTGAEKYFARGFYERSVCAQQSTKGGSFRVGIKCTSAPTAYWMMFDSFRLYFFG